MTRKALILIIASLLVLPMIAFSQTEVEGVIPSQAWTEEDSPYLLVGDVYVPDDANLSIFAGVDVLGDNGVVLEVTGAIHAEGTVNNPILFSRIQQGGRWDGINIIEAEKPCYFNHCIFEYAGTYHGRENGGALHIRESIVTVTNSLFQHNYSVHNSSAIYAYLAEVSVTGCEFYWNECVGGGTLGMDGGGILTVGYSVIAFNSAYYAAAMQFWPGVCSFDHVTISHNMSRDFESIFIGGDRGDLVTNCIIDGNPDLDIGGGASITYSCLYQTYHGGEHNIVANPLFVDPDEGDFHLQEQSPCIDTGNPNSPPDPDGTRTDMGAYYFHHEGNRETGNIFGEVTDEMTNRAISYALVQFGPYAVEANVQGQYSLMNIPVGEYDVTVSAENYATLIVEDLEVVEGENTFDFQLHYVGGGEQHFNPVRPTGLPYTIIIQEPLFEELAIYPGDEIAAFDYDLCVGLTSVTHQYPLNMTTWEEDAANELPGFTAGDPIEFLIWSRAEQTEFEVIAHYLQGNGTFGFIPYSEVYFTDYTIYTMDLTFQANYFEMISSYVTPRNPDVEDIFANTAALRIVYQDNGDIYIPGIMNTIREIDLSEGYRVFCNAASGVVIDGPAVDPETTYHLQARIWNWIGYPFPEPVDCEVALADIADDIQIVQSDDGRMWVPALQYNTLRDLIPGEGYMVFASNTVDFQYHSGEPLAMSVGITTPPLIDAEGAPTPTGLPYAVFVRLSEELQTLNPATVEIYDSALLVGKTLVSEESNFTALIAWGGSEELELTGFVSGHPMTVNALGSDGVVLGSVTSGEFGTGAFAEVQLTSHPCLAPKEFYVDTAYPNPFNPTFTAPFTLPANGEVSFTILNVLGQQVFSTTQSYEVGNHRFVFDVDTSGKELVSGVYFLQVQFKGEVDTQKIMLLK